jgi:hypothetical protein
MKRTAVNTRKARTNRINPMALGTKRYGAPTASLTSPATIAQIWSRGATIEITILCHDLA